MLSPKLREALEKDIKIVPGRAGGDDEDSVGRMLESTHQAALRMCYVVSAVIVVLFIVMAIVLIRNTDNIAVFTGVSAASGVGIGGLIILLMSNAREVVQAGILISLARDLPPQDRKDAFRALLTERAKLTSLIRAR